MAIFNHEDLYAENNSDRHSGPVTLYGSLVMERKNQIRVHCGVQRRELSFSGLESLVPTFPGYFFDHQVDHLLVVVAGHVRNDLTSLHEVLDLAPLKDKSSFKL